MISLFASVAFAAFVVSTVSGQSVPVVSINVGVDPVVLGGPVPLVLEPVPDLTFLTNHAALVSREFKKVKGVYRHYASFPFGALVALIGASLLCKLR